MPKRIVDGDGLWRSDKLARVSPNWIKSEYANLIPLAMANGSFEANARRIWSAVYSYNRPEITLDQVEEILSELERAKLLFRWKDEAGKLWGYWVGIEKPGRLPGQSRRGRNEMVGLEPPPDELRKFLDSIERSMESTPGNKKLLGFGSGSGFGSGINPSSEQKDCSDGEIRPSSKKPRQEPSREAVKLAALLRTEILRNSSDFKITQEQLRKWEATADRILRLDGRNFEEASALIRWAQRDEFWMSNILSMEKFRKQFDQLKGKAKNGTTRKTTAPESLPADLVSPSKVVPRSLSTAERTA